MLFFGTSVGVCALDMRHELNLARKRCSSMQLLPRAGNSKLNADLDINHRTHIFVFFGYGDRFLFLTHGRSDRLQNRDNRLHVPQAALRSNGPAAGRQPLIPIDRQINFPRNQIESLGL